MAQFTVPCSVYRGGTSRGVFFQEKHLPEDKKERNDVFLNAIDAYNPSQINGLGSGTSHSSKVVVIGTSDSDETPITYTFYQIGIGTPVVDDEGTCGNLMAAVGAFAVNEGIVTVDESATVIDVKVFNTNVSKTVRIKVPLINGKAKVSGDYLMPGIVTPGAKYNVDIMDPGGTKTGETFPLDRTSSLTVDDREYKISFIDIVNPFVFVAAETIGLTGVEQVSDLGGNDKLMDELNLIRDEATVAVSMAKTREEARKKSAAIPKIAVVAKPQDYMTTSGKQIKKEEIDIMAKMVSMGNLHRTFAGSGLYNLAAAILLLGTIPNAVSNVTYSGGSQIVRIGHPDGIAEVRVSLTEDGENVQSVGLERTAREIMQGEIFIPIR